MTVSLKPFLPSGSSLDDTVFIFFPFPSALPTPRCFRGILTPTVWQKVSGRTPRGSCLPEESGAWVGGRVFFFAPTSAFRLKRLLTSVPWKGSEMIV